MNSSLRFSFITCLVLLTGCDNANHTGNTENTVSQLIETNIKDHCIYKVLNPVNNISFNTVRLVEPHLGHERYADKQYYGISIEEENVRLLKQAKALEKIGLVTKTADYVIKNNSTGVYYHDTHFALLKKDHAFPVTKVKGEQFTLTKKGETFLKKLDDSDNTLHMCIGTIGVGKIDITELPDTKLKVLAEMEYNDSFDWVSDEDIVAAFGDLTEGVYDNALAGLIEARVIKTNKGYILENNKLVTIK